MPNETNGPQRISGKRGNALNFDGINDCVEVQDANALDATNAVTMEAWVKLNSGASGYMNIISKGAEGPTVAGYRLLYNAIADKLYIGTSDGVSIFGAYTPAVVGFVPGAWYHVVGMDDGEYLRIYVNGEIKLCQWRGTHSIAANTKKLVIGAYYSETTQFFNGVIDEVNVYDHALTDEEIYNHSSCGSWNFDEATGSVLYDVSVITNGNNGVLKPNEATGPQRVSGKIGNALNFDGSNDCVEVSDANALDATNAVSMEAWVKLNSGASGYMNIMSKGAESPTVAGYRLLYNAVADKLWIGTSDGVSTFGAYTPAVVGFVTGVWYHVIGMDDGEYLRIYVNGEIKLYQWCGAHSIAANTKKLVIGAYYSELTQFFNGLIDGVRVYDYALTEEEIEFHYTPPDAGAESNPTGNPIGGGTGYSFIVDPYYANYFVSDKMELTNALASAVSGDIIYIDDNAQINLTGGRGEEIHVPGGVTLASGRGWAGSDGGLLYTTNSAMYLAILMAAGPNVRFTGFRLRGPDPEIAMYPDVYQFANGISSTNPNLTVDNCEISGWAHTAVYLDAGCTNAYIHHNYIHHNRRHGLGYGVSHGYPTAIAHINSIIEANLFDYNRHNIASTGWSGVSYEARYNIVLEHPYLHSFDVHGYGDYPGLAQDWTFIHHNTFFSDWAPYAVTLGGVPGEEAHIHHNWFPCFMNSDKAIYCYGGYENVTIYNNAYNLTIPENVLATMPIAIAGASTNTVAAGSTVTFCATNSYDPDGQLVSYRWNFGDGNTAVGAESLSSNADYTFNDPGRYNVSLLVGDDRGIVARDIIPITVTPTSGQYVLSFWIKDSCRNSALTGYYYKQVLIDDVVVWEDDIAGDEKFQHIVLDVSNYIAGKSQISLALRGYCETEVAPSSPLAEGLIICWDDVALFGGNVVNGDFEPTATSKWTFSQSSSLWSGAYSATDVRSGYTAYWITIGYTTVASGSWGQAQQTVAINP
ncbi:MAG: PKD domain-containing protein [Kiritimatiellae bacterium]|nr:PKD domain-containing protein [Kiritimatiellia bacterium]